MALRDHNQRLKALIKENAQTLKQMQELLASLRASTSTRNSLALAQEAMTHGAILILDDNPGDVVLTRRVLQRLKLKNPLHVVTNGNDLISYLKAEDIYRDRKKYPYPVLLLLDLRMPGMNGFDVLAWLRDHPQHASVPVVVLSGLEELREVNRAYLLGARSFLSKPVTMNDVQTVVKKLAINFEKFGLVALYAASSFVLA